MGELVLKRVQAGIETTRGLAVPATKKLYGGPITINRSQPNRYAVEDRGVFTDKFRGNKQLVEAGWTWPHDVTYEDEPFYISTFLNGGITATGGATTGYKWAFVPDTTTDTLKTMTWESGDEDVQWQAPFSTTDTADYDLKLNDGITASLGGFASDWIPTTSGDLITSFSGFTPGLTDRDVESIMGWQARLFVDPDADPIGTTQILGRFISSTWSYHNQNKRKYFGDAGIRFSRLGRGRRQVQCSAEFEALDTAQYADYEETNRLAVRIGLYGTQIPGTSALGTTNASIPGGPSASAVTAIVTSAATSSALSAGQGILVGDQTFVVGPAGASSGVTSIPVNSQVPDATIPATSDIVPARTGLYDFWGVWDNFSIGSRDTNTTFKFDLMAMYSLTAGKECAITIFNGSSTL